MKKVVKDILIVFIICFTILNIIGMVGSRIFYYHAANMLSELFPESYEEITITKSELRQRVASSTVAISEGIQTIWIMTFIVSALISIMLGITMYLKEKFALKEILVFLIIGLVLVLIYSLISTMEMGFEIGLFFDEIIYCIQEYIIYYLVIYLIVYAIRYTLGKRDAKKLQETLEAIKKNG